MKLDSNRVLRPSISASSRSINLSFPEILFQGQLRPSQQEVVEIADRQLQANERRLHIVAPPGSGKTVLGLYLWAHLVRQPCLVLSPNSAIQSQWAARTDLFQIDQSDSEALSIVSTDPAAPALLTSLTYQSVTMPSRRNDQIDSQALELWADSLIDQQQATSTEEAETWINDLRVHNDEYFQKRFSTYKKKIRDEIAKSGDAVSLLHQSSRDTLEKAAAAGVGLLILDECHHLLGHWGRVLADALEILNNPIVIGLTATPPDIDGKDARDVARYQNFFGNVDFEVPVPAVVKDGFLAPYQDLAYFVRPTRDELKFIATADQKLKQLVNDLCKESTSPTPLPSETTPKNLNQWLVESLAELRLPTGALTAWSAFAKRDPAFALASRQFLQSQNIELPRSVDRIPPLSVLEGHSQTPQMEYWVPVLDRYVRHYLRRSPSAQCQQLAKDVTASLRVLGIQITETGTRPCVSPVGRVMAYSNNKTKALLPILTNEMETLGNKMRAVVIADFERSSAVSAQLKDLMDNETGGAIAAFKTLLEDIKTDELEPILLTGSTILIDDEIETSFLQQSKKWLSQRGLDVELKSEVVSNFRQIIGRGRDWSPRVYVEMITALFQQGLTRCLVGTRGLLGEGWDANRINVLVDLTTVTTSMSINQLRGRSFRLDPAWPEKLANNWDVVCIAPEFSKGFDDYRRFIAKHKNLYGVTDDGAIEKGVGHVHPAFTELKPEGLESSTAMLNEEMLSRSRDRMLIRETWKIGQPFQGRAIKAIETKTEPAKKSNALLFPPFAAAKEPWNEHSLTNAISEALIAALAERGLLNPDLIARTSALPGGYVRTFLQDASEDEGKLFADSLKQVLGPLDRPRYVIPRNVTQRVQTLWSKVLPSFVGRYFVRTEHELARLHAVPDVLARNKQDVLVFQKYWNEFVSPGEALFALRGEGQKVLDAAKQNASTGSIAVHEKEVFL